MHFEVFVEDLSGGKMLEHILPKIIGQDNTFKINTYKGIGHIPRDLNSTNYVRSKVLLNKLPGILRAYGKRFASNLQNYQETMLIICDLDKQCLKEFKRQLIDVLDQCNPKPEVNFIIAIEEGEAWLLGDTHAIKTAYPSAKMSKLKQYTNDSICGTWEILADSLYPGGSKVLKKQGYQAIGKEKYIWADKIAPYLDISNNKSPSFCYFRDKVKNILGN